MQELKFPIGSFDLPEEVQQAEIPAMIETIEVFPKVIYDLTQSLNHDELNEVYRPHGWNVRQLVHHCADSHMNALIRFKLALTEDKPTIKPYEEAKWAELIDTVNMPISYSLDIIKAVHARWTVLLKNMDQEDFARCYIHPEYGLLFRLDQALANYDWHCKHHLSHIRIALNK
ncbi:MAG: putative metal-dependent hydrolase [Flavobacteriales bacterium]|nr:putative metal-dependent hydrolase [Flavobacteriales bacterium]